MTTTLSEGVKVPDVGSVNWAGDLEVNWNLLNGALANLSGNVKLNRDNIWTGEQSFTLPIIGSITGTASRAIADEAGNSIKSSYGKLAENNTWSNINIFTNVIAYKDTVAEIGNYPASNRIMYQTFADKNGVTLGYTNFAVGTNGVTSWNVWLENKATNGVLSPTGTQVKSFMSLYINTDMSSKLKLYGDFIPNNTSRFNLGLPTAQWASVYSQSYYYNGTAWGPDKANIWTGDNAFSQNILIRNSSTPKLLLRDARNNRTHNNFSAGGITRLETVDVNSSPLSRISTILRSDAVSVIEQALYIEDDNGNEVTGAISFVMGKTGESTFRPNTNNTTNLGASTAKWKSFNGINPGALGLPDYNSCVDKTSEIPVASLDGNTEIDINDYFPNLTGWINVVISDTSGNFIRAVQGKAGTAVGFNNSRSFHAGATGGGFITLFMPIVAETWKSMKIQASSVTQFRFYPCLGNV